jgi:prepilin peptidase CpaA
MGAELFFSVGMVAAAGWDLAARRIPNALSATILFLGIVNGSLTGGVAGIGGALLGAVVGLALLLPLFHVRWIGAGDVKLLSAVGAWVGATGVLWVTIAGLALGGLVSAAMLADAGLRREVLGNLKLAALALDAPAAPRRAKHQLVPMAVAFAIAAVGFVAVKGGLS